MTTVKLTGNFLATARCLIFSDGGGVSWNFNQNTNTLTASATSGGTFLSSVGLADNSTAPIYTVGNSPLTANGTLTLTLNTQSANVVFAGPTTGAAAQPTFRALVAADIPVISYTNVSGLAVVAHTGAYSDLAGTPSIPVGANPSANVGLAAINGSAPTWMRSDSAPALNQAIAPTWTGNHIFTPAAGVAITLNGVAAAGVLVVKSGSAANASVNDVRIQRAGSTANQVQQGPNLTLQDSTGNTDSVLQHSGGQTELWQFNGSAWNLYWRVTSAGALAIPTSPAVPTITQALTGLAAYRSADTTAANNTLTADAQLTLTFNETGKYAIEIFLPFYEATLGTGGFQFDLNSGTATVGGIVFGLDGFVTGAIANAAVTSVSTATSASSVATSASSPSWYLAKGWMSITVAGTVAIRWAQASTLGADPTTLKAGAYFMATKIG